MKKLKTQILSLIVCVIMLACTLTGCALIVPNKSKALEADAIKIGTTVLSKQEVVNLWYSFYSENASYFYYYSEDQILEIFYKNVITKYAILEETKNLITEGTLVYTEGDDAKVWLNVFKYISGVLDAREKAIYNQQGIEGDKLPVRLQDKNSDDSDVKSYLYEDYEFTGLDDYKCDYLPTNNTGDKLSEGYKIGKEVLSSQVNDMIDLLKKFIYKSEVERDEDDEVDYTSIADLKNKLNNNSYYNDIPESQYANRTSAYEMYVGGLKLSAKANGKDTDVNTVLFNEIKRLYINYYENYVYNMFTSYVNSLVNKTGDNNPLSDKAIVTRYLQLLGKDYQNYTVEENYIAVLEAKATNSVILYHFNGENYYFTVNHLLVSFDDETKELLSEIPGSNTGASAEQYQIYKEIRDTFYKQILGESSTSWGGYKNVTYRDENGYDVYVTEDGKKVYFDKDYKVKDSESNEDIKDEDKETAYYYMDASEKVYLKKGEFDKLNKDTITIAEMEKQFNDTFDSLKKYIFANKSSSAETLKEQIDLAVKNNTELAGTKIYYSLSKDLISAYLKVIDGSTEDKKAIEYKIYTNLFMQHAFKYSADSASLGNELSNRIGMTISGKPDNNNVGGSTYVSEFTNGARELLAKYTSGTLDSSTIGAHNYVISDYGIHLIVINDVYKTAGEVAAPEYTFDNVFGDLSEEETNAKVAEIIEKLKTTYVCRTSSQTLYQYIYDMMRDELVGTSGSVLSQERNKVFNNYMSSGKATYVYKLSYTELMDAIK